MKENEKVFNGMPKPSRKLIKIGSNGCPARLKLEKGHVGLDRLNEK
jgi:hypothetical protein